MMRTLKCTVLTVLLLLPFCATCRPPFGFMNEWSADGRLALRVAVNIQSNLSPEIGLHALLKSNPVLETHSYNWPPEEEKGFNPLGFWSAGASFEFPYGLGEFVLGPKLFTELNLGFVSTCISVTPYTNFSSVDFRVTPEIGTALFGIVGLRYGYNFAPTGINFEEIGMHRFSVFITIVQPTAHNWYY